MSSIIEGFSGYLFIGDVHLTSRRPGRREDDYVKAVLAKLSESASIARKNNLYPICLGDLFHRANENDLVLLHGLQQVLKEFEVPLVVLAGSHDRTESWLTPKDALHLLSEMGCLKVVDQPGAVMTLRCKEELATLWATPAGYPIPNELPAGPGRNIMITHHDMDFNGEYPGAHALKEIENCDLLVNGHMHTPTPMVLKGKTACHNPGSITRVSVDLRKHRPVVSIWTPAHGLSLQAVPLERVAEHVFDLTGKEVYAADPRALKADLPKGLKLSTFAAKLRATESLEAGRTDDGAVLVEELENYFNLFDKPDNLKRYLTSLVSQVVTERAVS